MDSVSGYISLLTAKVIMLVVEYSLDSYDISRIGTASTDRGHNRDENLYSISIKSMQRCD